MKLNESSNPTLSDKVFSKFAYASEESRMTTTGAMNKTAILLAIAIVAASFVWAKVMANPAAAMPWVITGSLAGFVVALITSFKPHLAKTTAPIYAALEGLFLGGISALMEASYPGIVMNAVALTMAVFAVMLYLYRSEKIRATGKFRTGVIAATGGIALVYFVSFILGLFGVNVGFMHGGGTLSIVISLVVVAVAALNLILDFDFIDKAARNGAPKEMEWYGAFGLMVTLVWLYIEILRLLSKFASRD
ncbi:MAG: Bax inhibitor-1/YccA family protein [Mangrovibacterium sp.]